MTLGFTGTQKGMTQAQRNTVRYLFQELMLTELHHGCEEHADMEAHRIAKRMRSRIVGHPGTSYDESAGFTELRPMKPTLVRNTDIAREGVDGLVAAPRQKTEVLRSGTWSTVRRARRLGRRIWIVAPDGTFREEQR